MDNKDEVDDCDDDDDNNGACDSLWVWWNESLKLAFWTWGLLLTEGGTCEQPSIVLRNDASNTGLFTFLRGKSLSIDLSKLRTGVLHYVSYRQYVQRWDPRSRWWEEERTQKEPTE